MENKTQKSLISKMIPYMKGYRILFLLAVVFTAISSIITVIGPDKLKEITDVITKGLTGHLDLDKIGQIAVTLAVLYISGAIVAYAANFLVTTIIQRFSQSMRNSIAIKINKVPLAYFDSHSQGDTLSRVTNDVDLMTQSLNQSLGTLVSSTILLVGSIIMMFHTNVTMAFTTIGSVLVGFVLSVLIMAKSQPLFKKQQANLANINGFVEEIYSGHNLVTTYSAANESKEAFNKLNHKLYKSMWNRNFFQEL